MRTLPIGIIDSGLGGLSIAQAIWSRLPKESTIYLADHAFFPYGNKSAKVINRRLVDVVNYLQGMGIKALVVACNTVTATSINFLRQIYELEIIGTAPAIKPAVEKYAKEKILAMTTETTASSDYFKKMIKEFDLNGQIKVHPCPGLAEAIENYADDKQKLKTFIDKTMSSIKQDYTALVLGCTHYLLVKDLIKDSVKPHVIIIDPAEVIAERTANVLQEKNLLTTEKKAKVKFLTTGSAPDITSRASSLINQRIIFKSCSL